MSRTYTVVLPVVEYELSNRRTSDVVMLKDSSMSEGSSVMKYRQEYEHVHVHYILPTNLPSTTSFASAVATISTTYFFDSSDTSHGSAQDSTLHETLTSMFTQLKDYCNVEALLCNGDRDVVFYTKDGTLFAATDFAYDVGFDVNFIFYILRSHSLTAMKEPLDEWRSCAVELYSGQSLAKYKAAAEAAKYEAAAEAEAEAAAATATAT